MKNFTFILFLLFGFSLSSLGQWTQYSTGFPITSTGVRYLNLVDEEVIWLTGYDGVTPANQSTMFATTSNSGTSWTNNTIPGYSGYGTSMIFGIDALTAWVPVFGPSGGGAILKTTDGGNTWTEQTTASFSAPAGFPNMVYFWDANNGFCAGDPNGGYFEIYTTNDGGDNWTRVAQANIPDPVASDEYGVTGFFSVVGDTVWFSTNKSRLLKSLDRGMTWTSQTTPVTSSNQFKIIFKDPMNGIIYDNQSTPLRTFETSDGGDTWTEFFPNGPILSVDICNVPGSGNTWISTGNAEGVSFSYDGGHNWELFQNTTGMSFLTVKFLNPSTGWAGDFTTNATTGGINKYTGSLLLPANDVGVYSIDITPMAEPGDITPKVTIKNYGTDAQSFDITFSISGIYTTTVPIANLASLQTTQISFDNWAATEGSYTISVATLLTTDVEASNDVMEQTVTIQDLTEAYGYVAFDPTSTLPQGPAQLFLEAPYIMVSIEDQSTESFISAGTWGPDNKWYAASFYDEQTSTGGELVTIDPVTGNRQFIGFMGTSPVHGLSYDFTSQTMFAVTYNNTTAILNTVDLSNGSLSQVGLTNSEILINLACNSQGLLFAVDLVNDQFGSIDKTTGAFTVLFDLGFDAAYAQDMEFDRYTDTCYMAAYNNTAGSGEFYKVDLSLPGLIYVGDIAGGTELTGLAIPYIYTESIDEQSANSTISIYPNPSSEFLSISSNERINQISLIDSYGKLIFSKSVNKDFTSLNIEDLAVGTYYIEILSKNGTTTKVFSKIK